MGRRAKVLKRAELTEEQQKLFDVNLKKVRSLVNRYRGRLDSDELNSRGMEALLYSVQQWEQEKSSFSTYLGASFKNLISDMVSEKVKDLDTIPYKDKKDMKERLNELENVRDILKSDLPKILPEELEEIEDQIEVLREEYYREGQPKTISLDAPVSGIEDESLEILDVVEDLQNISQHDMATYNYLKEQIRESVSLRDYRIFEFVEEGNTNQEIADKLKNLFPDERQVATGEGISSILNYTIMPAIKKYFEGKYSF